MANPNFDEILSTTFKKYAPTFIDNVFDDRPLFARLMAKGKVQTIDGGQSIVEQLMYGENTTFASYSGYDTLDTTPQAGLSAAEYGWSQVSVNISISGIEEAKNKGASQIISLLNAKTLQAEESARSGLNVMGFGNGTGNAGKDFNGLENLIGDHTSAVTTVGGINCVTAGNEYWRSVVIDANADLDPIRSTAEWTNAAYTAAKGGDMFTFVLTTQELFEHYEASLEPQLRFTSNDKADAKFMNVMFKGRPVFFDHDCPTGVTYFPNEKYLAVKGHKDVWFTPTGFRHLPDVDARWSNIIAYGNMTTSNRARQAKVIGQTVA